MPSKRILIGIVCIVVAVSIVTVVTYRNSSKGDAQLIFSSNQMLNALWAGYKAEYLEPGTLRALDKQRDNVTTSEGQSYTLLRAVWMSDKETFDSSWQWTKDNLKHKDDNLFSWLFGKTSEGTYAVLNSQGGHNSASDADSDIALALIFAYSRWQDPMYLGDARGIIGDIWKKEVITIKGIPYLAANNLEKFSTSPTVLVNPSYLSPATYRIFAIVDTTHPWTSLADYSYDVINASMDATLDTKVASGLPPNWVEVNRTTGALTAVSGNPAISTNYGYDAFRLPWRLALDYQWFGTEHAKNTLAKMHFLSKTWEENKKLSAEYAHDGTVVTAGEAPAMYGGSIGYFMLNDPVAAKAVYESKLAQLYDSGKNDWHRTLSYYDSNWAWFGLALYDELLPNLAVNIRSQLSKQ